MSELYSQVRLNRGGRVRKDDVHREMTHRAAQSIARTFFLTSLEKVLSLPTERQRMICSDDGTGHPLDTIELGTVMKLARQEIGHRIDVLGMDACLMSTLEVAYQDKDEASVVVGSEQTEPGAGRDYARLLQDLVANPSMDAKELGRHAVARYIDSYQSLRDQWPVTQCAVDPSQTTRLAEALDAMEQALRPQMGASWSKVVSAQRASVMLNAMFRLVDLRSFCGNLAAAPLGAAVQRAAQSVLDTLRTDSLIIAERHLGQEVDGCGGLSVYMPGPLEPISPYYQDMELSKTYHWDEFLQEYHAAV